MFKEELNKFTGDRSGKGCNTRVSEVPNSQQLSREVCGEKHCPVTPFTLCFCTHSFRLVWRICSWPLAEKAVRLVLMVRKILALGWFDREHFFGRLCCSFFFFFLKNCFNLATNLTNTLSALKCMLACIHTPTDIQLPCLHRICFQSLSLGSLRAKAVHSILHTFQSNGEKQCP